MYDRTVDGQVLSFGHEGVLYRNSFVMYDKATNSKWLHVTGEALKGKMKGKHLQFIPSEILPWKVWRARHPQTKVLLGEKADSFMGGFGLKERISSYGLSVGEGRSVTLFRYALLDRVPVLDSTIDGKAMVLCFDRESAYAVAFVSRVQKQVLHFDAVRADPEAKESRPLMRDAESGSLWLRMTGVCLAGQYQDAHLQPLPATAWLGKRWLGFFSGGRVVGLEKL